MYQLVTGFELKREVINITEDPKEPTQLLQRLILHYSIGAKDDFVAYSGASLCSCPLSCERQVSVESSPFCLVELPGLIHEKEGLIFVKENCFVIRNHTNFFSSSIESKE
ncbi:unnamed protein product [Dovyalis caffra]|uniref:Uncharacterized protein n=1 Tax=Dovyalis caffra TaxID=77055 RepID=A0AAV1R9L9_9ROSI|nr:unnamed protein product [Dovyalis caffra]